MVDERSLKLSVVIPTYGREQVLLDTIDLVLRQSPQPSEVLIVDQTADHDVATEARLRWLDGEGLIRWLQLTEPSIPKAMNFGLTSATQPTVLFLDDDITASKDLVQWHQKAHAKFPDAVAVVGQVLQPGESPNPVMPRGPRHGLRADLEFPFFSTRGDWISNVMAGNLSVNRNFALAAGGFDENFVGVAYRFETEFAMRLIDLGGKIRFCPEASINHLRAGKGGTRSTGSHLTSVDPKYGVGDYYFALLAKVPLREKLFYILKRPIREVCTKFHLSHPWYIPVKLLGELRAVILALRLARGGRKLISGAKTGPGLC